MTELLQEAGIRSVSKLENINYFKLMVVIVHSPECSKSMLLRTHSQPKKENISAMASPCFVWQISLTGMSLNSEVY